MTTTPQSGNGDREERRERGMALIIVGWLLWGFALLVLFFRPAEVRLVGGATLLHICLALGALGLALNIAGWYVRRKAP